MLEKASSKIFFGMMAADRTVSFVCVNNYLSPLQKAALPGVAGALEHQLLFDTLASQARGGQRGLVDQVTARRGTRSSSMLPARIISRSR